MKPFRTFVPSFLVCCKLGWNSGFLPSLSRDKLKYYKCVVTECIALTFMRSKLTRIWPTAQCCPGRAEALASQRWVRSLNLSRTVLPSNSWSRIRIDRSLCCFLFHLQVTEISKNGTGEVGHWCDCQNVRCDIPVYGLCEQNDRSSTNS